MDQAPTALGAVQTQTKKRSLPSRVCNLHNVQSLLLDLTAPPSQAVPGCDSLTCHRAIAIRKDRALHPSWIQVVSLALPLPLHTQKGLVSI